MCFLRGADKPTDHNYNFSCPIRLVVGTRVLYLEIKRLERLSSNAVVCNTYISTFAIIKQLRDPLRRHRDTFTFTQRQKTPYESSTFWDITDVSEEQVSILMTEE
jgi:hypothetical protein